LKTVRVSEEVVFHRTNAAAPDMLKAAVLRTKTAEKVKSERSSRISKVKN